MLFWQLVGIFILGMVNGGSFALVITGRVKGRAADFAKSLWFPSALGFTFLARAIMGAH